MKVSNFLDRNERGWINCNLLKLKMFQFVTFCGVILIK